MNSNGYVLCFRPKHGNGRILAVHVGHEQALYDFAIATVSEGSIVLGYRDPIPYGGTWHKGVRNLWET